MINIKKIRSNEFLRTILSNTIWTAAGEIVFKVLNFALTILILRKFSIEDYGIFSFAITLTGILSVLNDLGITTLTIRDISLDRSEKSRNQLFTSKMFFSATYILLLVVIAINNSHTNIIILLAINAAINSVIEFHKSFFKAYEKMKFEGITRAIQGVSLVIIGSASLVLGDTIEILAIAFLISTLITVISSTYFLTKIQVSFKIIKTRAIDIYLILKKTFWFALATISSQIYFRVDSLMLFYMLGEYSTGIYNAAYNFILVASAGIYILINPYFPRFTKSYKKQGKIKYSQLVQKVTITYVITAIILVILITPFLPKISNLIFGEKYAEIVPTLALLIITTPMILLNYIKVIDLSVRNKQKIAFFGSGAMLIVNVLLNILILPIWSYLGAAITTLTSEILLNSLYNILDKRK